MSTNAHITITDTAIGTLRATQIPTLKPGHQEVLVKVAYSSVVPPDAVIAAFRSSTSGDDGPALLAHSVSGIVTKVGDGTKNMKRGNKVCGFTLTRTGLQEYAILPQSTCAQVPENLPLDDVVTILDSFVTAFYTLFYRLKLPIPTLPASSPPEDVDKPILIYGAGTTPGQYAVQLLKLAGYTNVIATSSSDHHDSLRSLGAKHTIDYEAPDVAKQIASAACGKLGLAMDCLSTEGTLKIISQVVRTSATVAILLPVKEGDSIAATDSGLMWMGLPPNRNPFKKGRVKVVGVKAYGFQENKYLKAKLMPEILPQLLGKGLIKPDKARVFNEGSFMQRVEKALELLRSGEVSREKVVVKVG
ncbi:chaperonin 10-like protein [Phlebopus sp. FC_14]|nr:chaperonin 10-like protein [Phlebopus sp. FC_14]